MTAPTKKELEILLRIKNEASVEMQRMGVDAREWGKKTEDAARKGERGFQIFTTAAKTAAAAIKALINPITLLGSVVGVGAIINLAKGMSDAADQAEAVQGKFELVFGERAKAYGANIDALAKQVGRSKTELRSMAADMQIATTEMLGNEAAAEKVTDAFVRLAIDVGEFRNVADADVMAKFTQAVLGSGRALREFGVSISPAEIEARALANTLKATTDELTEQDKAVANISLILERFGKVAGEADRSSEEFGSRMKELRATVQEVREEFGARLNAAIVQGLDDAGGAEKLEGLTRSFNAAVAEFARIGVAAAADVAQAASSFLDRFGGADGFVTWVQERGDVLVSELRLLGVELSIVAVKFGDAVVRMLDKLRPALELVGLVRSGPAPTLDDLEARRARLQEQKAAGADREITSQLGPIVTGVGDLIDVALADVEQQIESARRMFALEAERAAARERLFAAQARLNAAQVGNPLAAAQAQFDAIAAGFAPRAPGIVVGGSETVPGSQSGTGIAINEAQAAMLETANAAPNAAAKVHSLTQAWADGRVAVAAWGDAVSKAHEQSQRFAERQTGQLADAFLAVATGASRAQDAIKQFFRSFVVDLLRAQTVAATSGLFGNLFSGIFGAVNGAASATSGAVANGGSTISAGAAEALGGFQGGYVKGYARGGFVDPRDTVPAMLAPGEFVMNRDAVNRNGRGFMESINRGGRGNSGGSTSIALTINAADARSVVELLASDAAGFANLVTRAVATDRNLNASVRGYAT